MRTLRSELRMMVRSLTWWVVGVVAVVIFSIAFYPAIEGSPGFDELMTQLPESVRPLIGTLDITSPIGYLLSQVYLFFLPAVFLVYAIGRGASTIAGEEEAGTLDLLLAQPISRLRLYVTKAVTLIIGVCVLGIASWLPTLFLGPVLGLDLPWWNLLAVTLQLVLLACFFAVVALAVASAIGRRTIGAAVGAALAFITYLIDGFGQSIEWLEGLRPISPWYWYDPTSALADGVVIPGALVLIAASLVVAVVGGWSFQRRSLSS